MLDRFLYIIKVLGPFYVLLGIIIFLILTSFLLIVRNSNFVFIPFLLTIYLINIENITAYLVFSILRWLFLLVLSVRALRHLRAITFFQFEHWMFILFLLWAWFMSFHAPHPGRGVSVSGIMTLSFISFVLIIMGETKDSQSLLKITSMLLAVSVLITVGGGLLFASEGFQVASTMGARLSIIFANPGVFAGGMMLTVPVLIWKAISAKGIFKKSFYSSLFVVGFVMTFLAGSRASIVAALVALFILLFRYNIRLFLPLAVLSFVAYFAVWPLIQNMPWQEQFVSHLTGKTGLSGREELFRTALDLIKEKPIIGWGTGISTDLNDPTSPASSFHNAYLDISVDSGIAGLLMWFLFYLVTLVKAIKLCFIKNLDPDLKNVAWLILANITSLLLFSLVSGSTVNVAQLPFYWMLANAAILASTWRIAKYEWLYVQGDFYEREDQLGSQEYSGL